MSQQISVKGKRTFGRVILLFLSNQFLVVLQIVNDERGTYGLRYNDHARYRYGLPHTFSSAKLSILNQKALRQQGPSSATKPQNDTWKGQGV